MYKTMHNLRNRSKDKKGFTLAELLIVVAIIAVLVAIAVPIFSGQVEKAKEAADAANLRAAYAIAAVQAIGADGADAVKGDTTVIITQADEGWDYVDDIAGIDPDVDTYGIDKVTDGDKVQVSVVDGKIKFTIVTTP